MPIARYLSIPDALRELNLDATLASSIGADPTIVKLKVAFDQLYNRAGRPVSGEDIAANLAAMQDINKILDGMEAVSLVAHHWVDEANKVLNEAGIFGAPPAPVAPATPTPETTPTP